METRLESRRESGNQEDHGRATDFKGIRMSRTLLYDVQLHQHFLRDAYRFWHTWSNLAGSVSGSAVDSGS